MKNNHRIFLRILFLMCLFILPTIVFSQVVYEDASRNMQVGDKMFTLEDKSRKLTINDIAKSDKFIKSTTVVPNFGHTTSAVWMKITIENKTTIENLILQLNQPIIDIVEFYSFNPQTKDYEVIKMGE